MNRREVNPISMRTSLMEVGINIDDVPPAYIPQTALERPMPTFDERAVIHEILVERGAPARDLAWLTASCPSIEYARAFIPYSD